MKPFKEYLMEMPYIEVGDFVTDLELERIKTKAQFITFLKYFFGYSSTTPIDKYGSTIKFKSNSDRERIKKEIYNDPVVILTIKNLGMSRQEFKNLLMPL